MNVLVAEPSVRRQHPNVGLLKIAAYQRHLGHRVAYARGTLKDVPFKPDQIFISAIFTYYSKKLIRLVREAQRRFPAAKIEIGGVYPSLLPDHVEEHTGIRPHVGILNEVERYRPAYDLVPDGDTFTDTSLLFTTRGCWRSCKFCSVPTLEPTMGIVPNWQEQIDTNHSRVLIYDNNISAQPADHRAEVFEFLARSKQTVLFDNGFDCTRFDEVHAEEVASARHSKVRFALDYVGLAPHIERSIERAVQYGIRRSQIQVYVIYNFRDSVEDTVKRCDLLLKLGVQPYPQVYRPHTVTDSKKPYVSPKWTLGEIRMIRYFYTIPKFYKSGSYWDWKQAGCPTLRGSKVNFYPEMDSVRPPDFSEEILTLSAPSSLGLPRSGAALGDSDGLSQHHRAQRP